MLKLGCGTFIGSPTFYHNSKPAWAMESITRHQPPRPLPFPPGSITCRILFRSLITKRIMSRVVGRIPVYLQRIRLFQSISFKTKLLTLLLLLLLMVCPVIFDTTKDQGRTEVSAVGFVVDPEIYFRGSDIWANK